MSAKYIHGDCRYCELESPVDLIVTSPPYYSFRKYTDRGEELELLGNEETPGHYIDNLYDWGEKMWDLLHPEGNMFVVIGDKYAGSGGHNNAGFGASEKRGPGRYSQSTSMGIYEVRKKSRMGIPWAWANEMIEFGWILRSEIIWSKPNSIPTNARDRVEFSHEYIFHFTKTQKHYAHPDLWGKPWRKSSVWEISTAGGPRVPDSVLDMLGTDKHYAAFPIEIPRRAIEGWCPDDGVVLDPFGGSGTTALAAKLLGRESIYIDASAGYVRLAKWLNHVSEYPTKVKSRWGME